MEQLVPKLRFPGFEGEWEEKQLGELTNKIGDGLHGTPEYIYDSEIYFINGNNLINGNIIINENTKRVSKNTLEKNSKDLNGNSLLISINGTIGNISRYNNEKIMLGKSVGYLNFKENPNFYFHILQSNKIQIYFISELTGSTIKNLSLKTLRETKIKKPVEIKEQQKIATFLTSVDERIALLEKQKQGLETYKKGVMQQLFSQQLRFKDDSGNDFPDWEEKKLGEVFYSLKGKGLSKDKIVENGKNKCILYGELYTTYKELIHDVVNKTNDNEGELSLIGDLLIPASTTTTGIDLANVTALNEKDVLLGGDITILRNKNNLSNVFYAYYLSNHKKHELASYGQGTTIVHLYYSHFKNMKIDIPCNEEQQKIASFLSAIDVRIEVVGKQIEKSKVFKKGLLQQMFV